MTCTAESPAHCASTMHQNHRAWHFSRADVNESETWPNKEDQQHLSWTGKQDSLPQQAWAEADAVVKGIEKYCSEHFEQFQQHCWKIIEETAMQQARTRKRMLHQQQNLRNREDRTNWADNTSEDPINCMDRTHGYQEDRRNKHPPDATDRVREIRGTERQMGFQEHARGDGRLDWMDHHHNHAPVGQPTLRHTPATRHITSRPPARGGPREHSGRRRGRSPTTRDKRPLTPRPITQHKLHDTHRWDETEHTPVSARNRHHSNNSYQPTLQHHLNTIRDIWSGPIQKDTPTAQTRDTVNTRYLECSTREPDTPHNRTSDRHWAPIHKHETQPTAHKDRSFYTYTRPHNNRSPKPHQRETTPTPRPPTTALRVTRVESTNAEPPCMDNYIGTHQTHYPAPSLAQHRQRLHPTTQIPNRHFAPTRFHAEHPPPDPQRRRETLYNNIWAEMEDEGLLDHPQTHHRATPSKHQPTQSDRTTTNTVGWRRGSETRASRMIRNTHSPPPPHQPTPPLGGRATNRNTWLDRTQSPQNSDHQTVRQGPSIAHATTHQPYTRRTQGARQSHPGHHRDREITTPHSAQQLNEDHQERTRPIIHQTSIAQPEPPAHSYAPTQKFAHTLNADIRHTGPTHLAPHALPRNPPTYTDHTTQQPGRTTEGTTTTRPGHTHYTHPATPPTTAPPTVLQIEPRIETHTNPPHPPHSEKGNQGTNRISMTQGINREHPTLKDPPNNEPRGEYTWAAHKEKIWKALHAYGNRTENHQWQEYCNRIAQALLIADSRRERQTTLGGQHDNSPIRNAPTHATGITMTRVTEREKIPTHLNGRQECTGPAPHQSPMGKPNVTTNPTTSRQNEASAQVAPPPNTRNTNRKENGYNHDTPPPQYGDTHCTTSTENRHTSTDRAREEKPDAHTQHMIRNTAPTSPADTTTTTGHTNQGRSTHETATPQLTYRTALRQAWIWKTRHAQNTLEDEPFVDRENINYYTNIRAGPPAYLTEEQRQAWTAEIYKTKESCRKHILMPALADKAKHWHELRLQTPAPQPEKKKAITDIFREVWTFWLKKGMRNRDARKILKKADLYAEFTPAPPPTQADALNHEATNDTHKTQEDIESHKGPSTPTTGQLRNTHNDVTPTIHQTPTGQEHPTSTPKKSKEVTLGPQQDTQAETKPDHTTRREDDNARTEHDEQLNHAANHPTQTCDTPERKTDALKSTQTSIEPHWKGVALKRTHSYPLNTTVEQTHKHKNTTTTKEHYGSQYKGNTMELTPRRIEAKKAPTPPTQAVEQRNTDSTRPLDTIVTETTERETPIEPAPADAPEVGAHPTNDVEKKASGATATNITNQLTKRRQPPDQHHAQPTVGNNAAKRCQHLSECTCTLINQTTHPTLAETTEQPDTNMNTIHAYETTEATIARKHRHSTTPRQDHLTPNRPTPPAAHEAEHKHQQQIIAKGATGNVTDREHITPPPPPQSPKPIRVETPNAHYRNKTTTPKARKQPAPPPTPPNKTHSTKSTRSIKPPSTVTPKANCTERTLTHSAGTQLATPPKTPTRKTPNNRQDTRHYTRGPIVAIDLTVETGEQTENGDWIEHWEEDTLFFTPERITNTPKAPKQRNIYNTPAGQGKTLPHPSTPNPPPPSPPHRKSANTEHEREITTKAQNTPKEEVTPNSSMPSSSGSKHSRAHERMKPTTHTQQDRTTPNNTPDTQGERNPATHEDIQTPQSNTSVGRHSKTNPTGTTPRKTTNTTTSNIRESNTHTIANLIETARNDAQTRRRTTGVKTPDRPTQKHEEPTYTDKHLHESRKCYHHTGGQMTPQQTHRPSADHPNGTTTPPITPSKHYGTLSDISLDSSIPDTPTLQAQLEEAQAREDIGTTEPEHTKPTTTGQAERLGRNGDKGNPMKTQEPQELLERLSQIPTIPDTLVTLTQTPTTPSKRHRTLSDISLDFSLPDTPTLQAQLEETQVRQETDDTWYNPTEADTTGHIQHPRTDRDQAGHLKTKETPEPLERWSQMPTIPDTQVTPILTQGGEQPAQNEMTQHNKGWTPHPTQTHHGDGHTRETNQTNTTNKKTPKKERTPTEQERDEDGDSIHANPEPGKDMRRNRLRNLWKKYTKEKKKSQGNNATTHTRTKAQDQPTPNTVYDYTIKGLTTAELQVLGLGQSFIITQNAIDIDRIKTDIATYIRRLRLHYIFQERKADRAQHNLDLNRTHRLIQKDKPQNNTNRIQWRKPKSTFQPEETQRDINQIERNMETSIATQLTNRKLATPNIPQNWRKAIESLKTRIAEREITITQADKGGGIIALDYNTYIRKGTKYIEEEAGAYELDHTPEEKLVTTLKRERDKIAKQLKDTDTIPADTATYATHQTIEKITGMKFYYKIHKSTDLTNMPVRPLQSCIHSPTQHLSQILTDIYKPYVDNTYIPTYIRDTNHTLYELDGVHLRDTDTLAIADVVALYPSIEHTKGLKAIEEFTREYMYKDEKKIQALVNAFKIVITQNYVKWNGKIYKQSRGVAMGTPVAVTYANIYMNAIDHKLADTYPHIKLHRRFIDDNLFIIPSSKKAEFVHVLNALDPPALKYTVEYLGDPPHRDTLPFLDITFYLNEQREIFTRLYTKQTDKHQYLLPHSQHPRHIIRNIPRGVFARIRRLCKDDTAFAEDSTKAIGWLKDRGYKENILTQIRDETATKHRWTMIKEIEDRESRKRDRGQDTDKITQIPFINTYSTPTQGFTGTLKAQHKALDSLFKKARMKPLSAYRRKPNLGDMLIQPSLRIPIDGDTQTPRTFEKCGKHLHTKPCPCTKRHSKTLCRLCAHVAQEETQVKTRITRPISCDSKNLIYMIWCDTCNKKYIGETQQKLRDRFTQHLKNLNTHDQDLYIHFQTPGHRAGRMKIAILETLPTDEPLFRKMKESTWIRKLKTYTPYGLNEKMKESPLDAIEK